MTYGDRREMPQPTPPRFCEFSSQGKNTAGESTRKSHIHVFTFHPFTQASIHLQLRCSGDGLPELKPDSSTLLDA